ncbi:MAG: hypothetical protein IT581_14290 [Verrucomicrobiales bacterium]|nr:hypothetical protein [Verrucomicrobiales bacterium]
MKAAGLGFGLVLATAAMRSTGQEFLDRVSDTLTLSAFEDRFRARLSGTIDLEGYGFDAPTPGLLYSEGDFLFSERFSFFVDAQWGGHLYGFLQARVDDGFNPSDPSIEARLDEYALRLRPWTDLGWNLQVGKFATVVGNWVPRHLSWDNPFVSAPLPYENLTAIRDSEAPASGDDFVVDLGEEKYEHHPVIWGPAYGSGVALAGQIGEFELALELKNSALAARPESWSATSIGFDHPTVSGRLGYRPNPAWSLGISGSEGAYFRPEARPTLPGGRGIDDYRQWVLGQDLGFAWHHWQLWVEVFESRFEVPRLGDADVLSYYLEAKYKFTTRFFGAARWNQQIYGDVTNDDGGRSPWGNDTWRADVAVGFRFSSHLQWKLEYGVQDRRGAPEGWNQVVSAQVTIRY